MAPSAYQFGPYVLDASGRVLYRDGKDLQLPPKAAATLLLLLQNAGQVVEKEKLLSTVWPRAFVEEGSLARAISMLRKVLGRHGGEQYIQTISGRGYRFVAQVRSAAAALQKVMLAVVPFANLGGAATQEYFSDGLTEEMITELSRLNPERLGVIARTSAMRYKRTKKSVAQVGAELGVQYVLEGSVRRSAGRVRITAQLIQVSDQTHLWAASYDRGLGDILRIQSEVSRAIAGEIRIKLAPGQERRLAEAAQVEPQAYEAYLRGRHLWNQRTEDGMRKSLALYEDAVRRRPDFAMAYAGMADSHVMLACRGMVPAKESFRKAKAAARKALALDFELGDAHGSLAHVRLHDWDWEGLEQDFERALALNPAQSIVYYWYAEFLMAMGRPEEAMEFARRAYARDPLSPVTGSSLAMILYLARKYDEALDVTEHTRELAPDHFLPRLRAGLVQVQLRKYDAAISELTRAVRLAGNSTETLAALAMAYAAAGRKANAARLAAKLERQAGQRYVLPYNIAKIYAAGRNKDKAFAWLEAAYHEANPDLIELRTEPVFDVLRGDPRLTDLMLRIGWNPAAAKAQRRTAGS